jgi:hypothetical protein
MHIPRTQRRIADISWTSLFAYIPWLDILLDPDFHLMTAPSRDTPPKFIFTSQQPISEPP